MFYAQWYREIDRLVLERFEVSLEDVPDMQLASEFEQGTTPQEMFKIIEEEFEV